MTLLKEKSCIAYNKGEPPLAMAQATRLLQHLHEWSMDQKDQYIHKTFKFKNYYETMAFVNAVAWIANREDHHPDMEVGYNRCVVRYSTHSVGGLSENDFICAAKIDALL
ncbi:MAG: pterin-4-alpha-carbinolamine dehydratase [Gammaproteobacteria bacterium SG8_11]|nr:MAG: pterin-4-alpha-carbinolamine dehydratase [Gammaproteobacteria bacterium SG8_11]